MVITHVDNKYIKLDSDTIQAVVSSPNLYTKVDITSTINCCPTVYTTTIDTTQPIGWYIDLTEPVQQSQSLFAINSKNLISGLQYNLLQTPLDLSVILAECTTENCTIENSTISPSVAEIMKILIDNAFANLGIVSDVTVSFSGNIAFIANLPYNFIILNGLYGTTDNPIEILASFINHVSADAFFSGVSIYLNPSFYDATTITDGVYKVLVKISSSSGHTTEENCTFVDITVACQVATYLKQMVDNATAKEGIDDVATLAHLLHYAITNGSNCGCNCDELCRGYKELICLLDNVKISDCGC